MLDLAYNIHGIRHDSGISEKAKGLTPRPDPRCGEVISISSRSDYQTVSEKDKGGFMDFGIAKAIFHGHAESRKLNTSLSFRKLMQAIEKRAEKWDENRTPVFFSALPFNADSPFVL